MGQDEELFLDITVPVWMPASVCEGRVVGQHKFPFSITIPRDATIAPAPKAAPKCFSLPPTFSERASPAYIDYRLFLTVRRGRLRLDKQCVSFFFFQQRVESMPSACIPVVGCLLLFSCRLLTEIFLGAQVVNELCVPPTHCGETAISFTRARIC